jgi:hypothetical protein
MTKAMIIISAILLFAGVAAASSIPGLGGSDSNTPTLDAPGAATAGTTTSDDVRREDRRADDDRAGEDVRGPCDEAEHANDPRCTGATPQAEDRHDEDDDAGDDHGRNRGPGGNSGPGGGGHGDDD